MKSNLQRNPKAVWRARGGDAMRLVVSSAGIHAVYA
jgi:hypothetical protein